MACPSLNYFIDHILDMSPYIIGDKPNAVSKLYVRYVMTRLYNDQATAPKGCSGISHVFSAIAAIFA